MKKIIYSLLLLISLQAYAIVIHNPNGVAVWFDSAVTNTSDATINYDSIASATLNQILATQLKSGDTIYVQDSLIANKIDSLISILNNKVYQDSISMGILQQIADNTAQTGAPQYEHKEYRMMFNDTYSKHNIVPGNSYNQLYMNNLSTMQDVGDRTFRNSDGTPYVILAEISYEVDGNTFTEFQSFDAGITTYNFKYSKVVEITLYIIKDHNSHLDSNGGISEIKAFPTYTNGELTSTIYANIKLIKDVKE